MLLNWGIFLLNGSPLQRSQRLSVRTDAVRRKKLLEPRDGSLRGLRKGGISQPHLWCVLLERPPAMCQALVCTQQ